MTRGRMLFVLSLGCAPLAQGQLTVGPHGRYATVQAAIDAALAGGDDVIKVERGLYKERIAIDLPAGRSLVVSGGWNDRFNAQLAPDPADPARGSSVLDGGGAGTVVTLRSHGDVTLRGVSVTGGGGPREALLSGVAADSGSLRIEQCVFWGTHVRVPSGGFGLLGIAAREGGTLAFRENWVQNNSFEATTPGAHANGGMEVWVSGTARAYVRGNHFLGNVVRASGAANTAALSVEAQQEAQAFVEDNRFAWNRAESASGQGCCIVRFGAEFPAGSGRPRLEADRNQVYANVLPSASETQLYLQTAGGSLRLANTVVADGLAEGVQAWNGGEMQLSNLTVTGHAGVGLRAVGAPHLTNSLFFANGVDLDGTAVESHNLYGVDPRFADAAAHDYRLRPGSPAIDRGLTAAPGGVGPLDVYRETRVVGSAVDVGADEAPYVDGEPACRVLLPDLVVGASTPACRCLSASDLRSFRCGFPGADVFVDLRLPTGWKPDAVLATPVTLHPWGPVEPAYSMAMEALIEGQWVPQAWLGPAAAGLKQGQLVVEPFQVKLPAKGRTPLRVTLKYQRLGAPNASRLTFEIVAGDPNPQPN